MGDAPTSDRRPISRRRLLPIVLRGIGGRVPDGNEGGRYPLELQGLGGDALAPYVEVSTS